MLAEVSRLSLQVEDFLKKLYLFKIQCAKLDTRVVSTKQRTCEVKERAVLQKREILKHLEKVVEEYNGNASFDMDATIVFRSTFMAIFSSIEHDMHNHFPNFDLARLQCMKNFLEMRRQERETDSNSETGSSEAYLPLSPKGTPTSDDGPPPLPKSETLPTHPPPSDDTTPPNSTLE